MNTRRQFIAAAVLAALAAPAARLLAPPAAAAAGPRAGAFFLVNGWVLTAADLAQLDPPAA